MFFNKGKKYILCTFVCVAGILSGCHQKTKNAVYEYTLPEYEVYSCVDFVTDYGVYSNVDGILQFRDKESGKEVIVSNTPNETEKNESNPAYIGFSAFVFVNEDKLYTIDRGIGTMRVRIEMSGLDRSNIKEIFSEEGMQVLSYVNIDNHVYFFLSGPTAMKNQETGMMEYDGGGRSELWKLNLDTNEVKSTGLTLKGPNYEAWVMGAEKDTLYYTLSGVDEETEEYVAFYYKYNTQDGTVEEVLSNHGKAGGSCFVKENKIYYRLFDNIATGEYHDYCYDMAEKTTKELESNEELEEMYECFGRKTDY